MWLRKKCEWHSCSHKTATMKTNIDFRAECSEEDEQSIDKGIIYDKPEREDEYSSSAESYSDDNISVVALPPKNRNQRKICYSKYIYVIKKQDVSFMNKSLAYVVN